MHDVLGMLVIILGCIGGAISILMLGVLAYVLHELQAVEEHLIRERSPTEIKIKTGEDDE